MRPERPLDIPLFSGLPPDGFRALVERLSAWEADDGALIVAEGEQADSVYVVVRGAVRVERGDAVLATLPPGSFFGEMALLSRHPRVASVHAVGRTEPALFHEDRDPGADQERDPPAHQRGRVDNTIRLDFIKNLFGFGKIR